MKKNSKYVITGSSVRALVSFSSIGRKRIHGTVIFHWISNAEANWVPVRSVKAQDNFVFKYYGKFLYLGFPLCCLVNKHRMVAIVINHFDTYPIYYCRYGYRDKHTTEYRSEDRTVVKFSSLKDAKRWATGFLLE